MIINEDDYLAHYGTPRHSGRYPWGSGGNSIRSKDFLGYVDDLKKQGMSETDIAKGLGISTTELRARRSIARNEERQAKIAFAQRLHDKGMSNVAIGERMGLNESSVRALLAPGVQDRADVLLSTANMLREQVAAKKFIDVGSGVENHLGISDTKLRTAVAVLREEGYEVHTIKVPQLGTGELTNVKVLAPPGTTWGEVMKSRDEIQQIMNIHSEDGGRTYFGILPPLSVNPDRVGVRYGPDGGAQADGVIYVRPGVSDVSLGSARYAQVRIKVGEDRYLKGMAMYRDDLPDGVDLMFNTNKKDTGNKLDAMKKLETDPDNPFGSYIKRQLVDRDADGNEILTSAMNIVHEEGNWSDWSRNISSQMLSKQSPSLARAQLNMTYERRLKEFNEIQALTNPTVRKKLLETFGDETDASAVQLEAAAINVRQAWHAILPLQSMKENQVYAPNYMDGERVALIRYPHGGKFEIPDLVVNNGNREGRKLLGDARDAIGIHPKVAERLSGADFDGDAVLVIPNNSNKIKSDPALEQLRNFDPKAAFAPYDGMRTIDGGTYRASTNSVDYGDRQPSSRGKGIEMGSVSNLITDMTLRGASSEELSRAVRHSMVVIDAEKHHLNYRQSARDLGIADLKAKYQGGPRAGAATLISRATADTAILDRKPRPARDGGPIDRATGRREFVETGATNWRTGKPKKQIVDRLSVTDDAHTLSSGTRMERVYADHSNKLKALANEARRSSVNTPSAKYSPSAKRVYANEVASLNHQLQTALRNRPLERQAQLLANTIVKMKRQDNPNMDAPTLKKIKAQALEEARNRTGARKVQIKITETEWDAIQAGAISDSRLRTILANADLETVRALATPRIRPLMTSTMTRRAEAMFNLGYTRAQVAAQLGVSLTTLDTATNE